MRKIFIPSTDPFPWGLFHRDWRLGEVAGAHIVRRPVSSPLSFHEKVCGGEENQLVHMNPLRLKLRTEERQRRRGAILEAGRSSGAKRADVDTYTARI